MPRLVCGAGDVEAFPRLRLVPSRRRLLHTALIFFYSGWCTHSGREGSAIPRLARAESAAVLRTVGQVLVAFSLLVAFTTSAAAALCLQMDHGQSSAAMAGTSLSMEMPGQDDHPSAKACCYQQPATPAAVNESQRGLPLEESAGLPAPDPLSVLLGDVHTPPGVSDGTLEKRDHLRPSLTVLSISRT